MRTPQSPAGFALAACVLVLGAAASEAATTRFVAGGGNDSGTCTRAAPCRTLQRGVDVTPANGTVVVLDAGGYGASLAITKSITISADGASANLPGGLTIDAPGGVVVLRGLLVSGGGTVPTGIRISNATAVHIENCVVERFSGVGIRLRDTANAELFVNDTTVRYNGGNGLEANGTGASRLIVDNSHFDNNGAAGLNIESVHASSITRTTVSGNAGNGIIQFGGSMAVARTSATGNGKAGFRAVAGGTMTLESSISRNNVSHGLFVGTGAAARISNSTFTGSVAIHNSGGTVLTRQNNTVLGDVLGTLTPLPAM
jgi:hypothetical protein